MTHAPPPSVPPSRPHTPSVSAPVLAEAAAAGLFAIATAVAAVGAGTRTGALSGTLSASGDGVHTGLSGTSAFISSTGFLSMSGPPQMRADVMGMVSHPSNAVMAAMLAVVAAAALWHFLWRLTDRASAPAPWPLIAGLGLAALYHLVEHGNPLAGFATSAGAAALMVWGITSTRPEQAHPPRATPAEDRRRFARGRLWTGGFIAGWLLMVACTTMAEATHLSLGLLPERAMLLGLLVAALIATRTQLFIGGIISFSLAVIWVMIGVAAGTVSASITVATACVLGISALAVVIVRVTT